MISKAETFCGESIMNTKASVGLGVGGDTESD